MKKDELHMLGWLGMTLSVVSYFLTVNGSPAIGVPMATVGCLVYGFYAHKTRVWNLLAMQAVFLVVNITGLVHIFL